MSQLNELPFRDLPLVLEGVFEAARRRSEFDFCRALLRDGVSSSRAVDPLFEARRFIHQYITLLEAPIEESLKLRLMLTLYCHAIEMHDFYHLVANLLRIAAGQSYAVDPFSHDPRGNRAPADTVEQKASRLAEWAEVAGIEELGDLVTETVIPEVRRAFSTSAYSLDESQFHYRAEGTQADSKLGLEWCLPRFNRGVAIALTFIDATQRHQQTYLANKMVTATIDGQLRQIELIVRGGVGLSGYREVQMEGIAPVDAALAAEESKI